MTISFSAVCIPPMFVKKANALLSDSNARVATVVGFPFGYSAIESKVAEAVLAIVDGADELDIMINLVAIKNKDWQYVAREISTVLSVTKKAGKKIKVIVEASLLNDEEIIACCDIYGAAGVDFLQTATGIREIHVSMEQLKLMRNHLADAIQLKLADPVCDLQSANEWIAAGANRIVCSNPLQVVKEAASKKGGMIFGNENAYNN